MVTIFGGVVSMRIRLDAATFHARPFISLRVAHATALVVEVWPRRVCNANVICVATVLGYKSSTCIRAMGHEFSTVRQQGRETSATHRLSDTAGCSRLCRTMSHSWVRQRPVEHSRIGYQRTESGSNFYQLVQHTAVRPAVARTRKAARLRQQDAMRPGGILPPSLESQMMASRPL